jgi:alkylhydroperoxidase/carboxymuconolactone decarboxylase family protein YurZ
VYEHIEKALKHGATGREVFEALETSLIPARIPTFATGVRALMKIEAENRSEREKK